MKIRAAASPKIRPAVRMTPVTMPGIASGRTTWTIVCHLVVPSARLACRSSSGTARIACSVRRAISGRLNTVSANAPLRAVKPEVQVALTNSARPNRPTTMDGTELISSWRSRIELVTRPSPAYSAM